MKNLPLLFLGIFSTLVFSWTGLVLSSHLNLGYLTPTTSELDENGAPIAGETLYPIELGGIGKTGKDIYIDQGCVACHTQQIRPKGFGSDYERGWGKPADCCQGLHLPASCVVGIDANRT